MNNITYDDEQMLYSQSPWPDSDQQWHYSNSYSRDNSNSNSNNTYWSNNISRPYYHQPHVLVVPSSTPVQESHLNHPNSPSLPTLEHQYSPFGDPYTYPLAQSDSTLKKSYYPTDSNIHRLSPVAVLSPSLPISNRHPSTIFEHAHRSSPSQPNRYQIESFNGSERWSTSTPSQQWHQQHNPTLDGEQNMVYPSSYPSHNIEARNESTSVGILTESQSSHQEHYNQWIQTSSTDPVPSPPQSHHSQQHNFRQPINSDLARLSPVLVQGNTYNGNVAHSDQTVPKRDSDVDKNNYRQELGSPIYPHLAGYDSVSFESNSVFTNTVREQHDIVGSSFPNTVASRYGIPEQRENISSPSNNGSIGYTNGHSADSYELDQNHSGLQPSQDRQQDEQIQRQLRQHHDLGMDMNLIRSNSARIWNSPTALNVPITHSHRYESSHQDQDIDMNDHDVGGGTGSLTVDTTSTHSQFRPQSQHQQSQPNLSQQATFYPNLGESRMDVEYRASSEGRAKGSDIVIGAPQGANATTTTGTPTSSISIGFTTTHMPISYNQQQHPQPSFSHHRFIAQPSGSVISLNDEYAISSEGFKSYNLPSNPSISPALTQHPSVYATMSTDSNHSPAPVDTPEPIDEDVTTVRSVPSQLLESTKDDDNVAGPSTSTPKSSKKKKRNDSKSEEMKDDSGSTSKDNSGNGGNGSSSSKRHQRNGSNSNTEEGNSSTTTPRPQRKVRDKSIATHIACTFCRRRKIACIAGPSQDRDVGPCMPCAKRELICQRPPTNRRGQRRRESESVEEQSYSQSQVQEPHSQYTQGVARLTINEREMTRVERASSASSSDEASPITPVTPRHRSAY